MDNFILYSSGCPKCEVLKQKMIEKNIDFTECTDIETMLSLGIEQVPVLSINGELYEFAAAVRQINEREENL